MSKVRVDKKRNDRVVYDGVVMSREVWIELEWNRKNCGFRDVKSMFRFLYRAGGYQNVADVVGVCVYTVRRMMVGWGMKVNRVGRPVKSGKVKEVR